MNDDERPEQSVPDEPSAAAEQPAPVGQPAPAGQLPAEITHLVRERAEARAARDWERADRLKAEIESAGWKVVDTRGRTSVSRAAPADVEVGGVRRYGSWRGVESRLAEPATAPSTVVAVASEDAETTARLLAAIERHAPAGTQVVLVANDPSADAEAVLSAAEALDEAPTPVEVVRTSARLGYAAALNIGLHRASGEVVILADGSAWPDGDAITPVLQALLDPAVAAAGAYGLVTTDARVLRPSAIVRAEAAPVPDVPVVALELGWLGFRRSDFAAFGPLDEHFVTPAWLDVWWSLRLRTGEFGEVGATGGENDSRAGAMEASAAETDADTPDADTPDAGTADGGGPEADAAEWTPRLALQLDLPLERQAPVWPPERIRFNRRNAYRVIDDFAGLPELLAGSGVADADESAGETP